jgi:hypothetical protein
VGARGWCERQFVPPAKKLAARPCREADEPRGGEAAPRAGSGEREKRGGGGGGGRSGEEQVPDLLLRLPRRLPWPPCRRCRHALPDAPHLGSLDPIAAEESISRRRSPLAASTSLPLGKA